MNDIKQQEVRNKLKRMSDEITMYSPDKLAVELVGLAMDISRMRAFNEAQRILISKNHM